jgi:DNA-binding transcriptional regulator YhcF (GntR family)
MQLNLEINEFSSVPKYLQIVEGITRYLQDNSAKRGSRLPTINELSSELGVGRVTIVNAYDVLKKQGIIDATHGKGYYVKNPMAGGQKRVFLLFDAMNGYKEVLYRSFIQELGNKYQISIFFYYYNYQEFCRLIEASIGHYDHYVVLPHFNFDVSRPLLHISRDRLLLMDKEIDTLKDGYAAVFQNFYKDTFNALESGLPLIKKYNKINLVLQKQFQFIPTGIIRGFADFCKKHELAHELINNLTPAIIRKDETYFVISDLDLINVVRYIKDHVLVLGRDIGLISFDDTPLKTVLADGITTISTDFALMGKTAARMIKKRIVERVENPSGLIIRNSL